MSTPASESKSDSRFQTLLQRVADGDASATETLIDEYGDHILRAVRRRMNRAVRDRFDSEDFAQAVWASFFDHISVVQNMQTEGELAGFLGKMARNKVIDAGRRRQVRHEDNAAAEKLPYVVTDNRRRVSQPTPSQFAVANEKWDKLSRDQDGQHLRLLNLLRSGASRAEIAASLGMSERNIRRIITRFAEKSATEEDSE